MDEHRHSRTNTDETDWMDDMDGVSRISDLGKKRRWTPASSFAKATERQVGRKDNRTLMVSGDG